MKWGRLLTFLSICLVSPCVWAIQILHNIRDLGSTDFGQKPPRHGLLLLHWLANHVSIASGEDFLLLKLDPERGDYGFQHLLSCASEEHKGTKALPCLEASADREYFSVGNLSSETLCTKLPPYVTQDFYNFPEDQDRDLDRVVVRVQRNSPTRADKVYITQRVSNEEARTYNHDNTYEISTTILRQVQALSKALDFDPDQSKDWFGNFSDKEKKNDPRLTLKKNEFLNHLKNVERLKTIFEEPSVGWLLSLAGYDIDARYKAHDETWGCSTGTISLRKRSAEVPQTMCEGSSVVKLEVRSTLNGYARLVWTEVPKNIAQLDPGLLLFSGDTITAISSAHFSYSQTSGSKDTWTPLNHGLQLQLLHYKFVQETGLVGVRYKVIWRGPKFDSSNRALPTSVSGYDASLQLFTKGGYACARLYVKKSFKDWKEKFSHSWVGFYASEQDEDRSYKTYEWVSNFQEVVHEDGSDKYTIYEHKSSMSIGPGVQARFLFLDNSFSSCFLALFTQHATVKACTTSWEGAIEEF